MKLRLLFVSCALVHFSLILAQRCELTLTRVLGRTSNYVWVCDCLNSEGMFEAAARTQVDAPKSQLDTDARATAFLRCTSSEKQRLLHTCLRDRRAFERQAQHVLSRCLHAEPSSQDLQLKGPFMYNPSTCQSRFVRFIGANTGGVWICRCPQEDREEGFQVVSGRAQFLTDVSPIGSVEEVSFLQNCTGRTNKNQLQQVCRQSPGDFELLGLQLLQVCCKRARTRFDAKFRCAAIVPGDVTPLKVFP